MSVLESVLESGQTLRPGHSLTSVLPNPNSGMTFSFWMQTDGNVVLYEGQDSIGDDTDVTGQPPLAQSARWATHTGPGQFTPSGLIMQTDGNLVLYDTSGQPHWASQTEGNPGAYLIMQTDGNAVIYRAGSTRQNGNGALWATNTVYHVAGYDPGGFIPPDLDGLDGSDEEAGESPAGKR